ncbi:hypothetical protein [Conexibacter sp. SYSU D00693]|uniref:hypothetical protein n=1 Tax=Conexibacter sp. SYSU D00693 TaxID=2812560 RepID=UPI00196AB774|nr:hypothetical protein [Conexibacter sp. SYSU D00693]
MQLRILTRPVLAAGAVAAALGMSPAAASAAPAAPAGPPPPIPSDPADPPTVTAHVELLREDGSLIRRYDCAWQTAPDTDDCWFVVHDGPDRVRFLKAQGAAKATTTTGVPGRGQGEGTLEQRADGTWLYRGSHTFENGFTRTWGFVADPSGTTWVRWEVSDQPSTAGVARASTSRRAIGRASSKLRAKRKVRGR